MIDVAEFKEPAEKAIGKAEMQMATQLIASMTTDWQPELYDDEYHEALEKLIEEKSSTLTRLRPPGETEGSGQRHRLGFSPPA